MVEFNEQDPITGRKLPRLVNYNNQESVVPTRDSSNIKLPTVNRNYNTSGVQLVDYTQSIYDNPGGTYIEDLPYLEEIRGNHQGFFSALGSGIGRVALNIIPTVIGNTASILDYEDYYNQDKEVGNSIARAMEEFKSSVNEALPMYGESDDMGDSAWWLSRGASLAESIGAFAITGAGIGGAFNMAGKALGTINGLSRLGNAGKAAATVLSSVGLNQAESVTTAMQVYDSTYQEAVSKGKSDDEAKQLAADAAAYSVNINRANVLLNLTSAGAFIRGPKQTRQVREFFNKEARKEILGEGAQEYAEETINLLSQKEGERYGQAKANDKKYQYDIKNSIDDVFSAEGFESGIMGFIGGAGQTGLTRLYNKINGRAKEQDEAAQSQLDSLARIEQLESSKEIPSLSNVFKNATDNLALIKEINDASETGDDAKVSELKYKLFNNQLLDALDNGTVDKLEDVYKKLESLTPEQAEARGLDTSPTSPTYYKGKAKEALSLITDVEEGYLDIVNKGYLNGNDVLGTYVQGKISSRELQEQKELYNQALNSVLNDKVNLGITEDVDTDSPSDTLSNLPSYNRYKANKVLLEHYRDKVIKNNDKYIKLTSSEHQAELLNKLKESIKAKQDKANEDARKEAEKEAIKSREDSKKKVDASKAKPTTEVTPSPGPTQETPVAETPVESTISESVIVNLGDKEYTYDPVANTVTDPNGTILSNEGAVAKAIIKKANITPLSEEDKALIYGDSNQQAGPIDESDTVTDEEVESKEAIPSESTEELEVTDENYVTKGDKVIADSVTQELINKTNKELLDDGNVRPSDDSVELNKELEIEDLTIKRTVGNTIISLNIDYTENILGSTTSKTNYYDMFDNYDENGDIIINSNFDSRLQSPNQFKEGTEVNVIIPTFEQISDRGGSYTRADYDKHITDVNMIPIAFTDDSGRIIGYLPTQDNVYKRVDEDYRDSQMIANKQLRETIYNNRESDIKVKITDKSNGTLILNLNNKSMYDALGDGSKLSDNVHISIFKNNDLKLSLASNFNKNVINKDELEAGRVYAILPTANGSYVATPMKVNKIGLERAEAALKLIQLFKANPKYDSDAGLIAERDAVLNNIDLNNPVEFKAALDSIIYVNNENDAHMVDLGKLKLNLGVTSDESFSWNDVKHDPDTQRKIVALLAERYSAVQLSKFGGRYTQYKVQNGKLTTVRHNSYVDYLNAERILETNVQGVPIEGEPNQRYFTAQSVIQFSTPIITNRQIASAQTTTAPAIDTPSSETEVDTNNEEAIPAEPKKKSTNKLGIKFKPKNRPQIEEDINFMINLDNATLDKKVERLMKKCQG